MQDNSFMQDNSKNPISMDDAQRRIEKLLKEQKEAQSKEPKKIQELRKQIKKNDDLKESIRAMNEMCNFLYTVTMPQAFLETQKLSEKDYNSLRVIEKICIIHYNKKTDKIETKYIIDSETTITQINTLKQNYINYLKSENYKHEKAIEQIPSLISALGPEMDFSKSINIKFLDLYEKDYLNSTLKEEIDKMTPSRYCEFIYNLEKQYDKKYPDKKFNQITFQNKFVNKPNIGISGQIMSKPPKPDSVPRF